MFGLVKKRSPTPPPMPHASDDAEKQKQAKFLKMADMQHEIDDLRQQLQDQIETSQRNKLLLVENSNNMVKQVAYAEKLAKDKQQLERQLLAANDQIKNMRLVRSDSLHAHTDKLRTDNYGISRNENVEDLWSHIDELTAALHASEQSTHELQTELESIQKENQNLRKQLEEFKANQPSTNHDHSSSNAKQAQRQNDELIARFKDRISTLELELQTANAEHKFVQRSYEAVNGELNECREHIEELENALIEAANGSAKAVSHAQATLMKEQQTRIKHMEELLRQRNAAQAVPVGIERLTELEKEIEDKDHLLIEQQQKIDQLTSELNRLQSKISEDQVSSRLKSTPTSGTSTPLSSKSAGAPGSLVESALKVQVGELKAELLAANQQLVDLTTELTELKEQKAKGQRSGSRKSGIDSRVLEDALAQAQKQVVELTTELSELRQSRLDNTTETTAPQSLREIVDLRAELTRLHSELESKEESWLEKEDELYNELDEKDKEIEDLRSQIESSAKVGDQRLSFAPMMQSDDDLKSELAQKDKEIATLRGRVESLTESVKQMRLQLDHSDSSDADVSFDSDKEPSSPLLPDNSNKVRSTPNRVPQGSKQSPLTPESPASSGSAGSVDSLQAKIQVLNRQLEEQKKEINELEKEIYETDKLKAIEIAQLKSKITELEDTLENQEHNVSATVVKSQLESQLQMLRQQNSTLTLELAQVRGELAQLKNRGGDSNAVTVQGSKSTPPSPILSSAKSSMDDPRIQMLEKEISKLKTEASEYKNHLEQLEQSVDESHDALKAVEEEKETLRSAGASKEKQIEKLNKQLEEALNRVHELDRERTVLQESCDELEESNQKLIQEQDEMEDALASADEENQQLNHHVETLEKQIEELKETLQTIQNGKAKDKDKSIAQLKAVNQQLQDDKNNLEQMNHDLQETNKKLKLTKLDLEKYINDCKSTHGKRIEDLQQTNVQLTTERDHLENIKSDLTRQVEEVNRLKGELEKRFKNIQDTNKLLQTSKEAVDKSVSQLREENNKLSKMKEKAEHMEQRVQELTKENNQLTNQIKTLKETADSMLLARDTLESAKEEWVNEKIILEKEKEQLQADRDDAELEIEHMEEQMQELKLEIESLRNRPHDPTDLGASNRGVVKVQQVNESLTRTNSELNRQIVELERSKQDLEKQLRVVETARNSNETARANKDDLVAELRSQIISLMDGKDQLKKAQNRIKELEDERTVTQDQVTVLERKLQANSSSNRLQDDEKNRMSTRLQEENEELKSDIERLQRSLVSVETKAKELESNNKILRAAAVDFERTMQQMQTERLGVRTVADASADKFSERTRLLQKEVSDLEDENIKMTREVKKLQRELLLTKEDSEKDLSVAKAKLNRLRDELAESDQQRGQLKERYDQSRREVEALHVRVVQLEQDLDDTRGLVAHLKRQNEEMERHVSDSIVESSRRDPRALVNYRNKVSMLEGETKSKSLTDLGVSSRGRPLIIDACPASSLLSSSQTSHGANTDKWTLSDTEDDVDIQTNGNERPKPTRTPKASALQTPSSAVRRHVGDSFMNGSDSTTTRPSEFYWRLGKIAAVTRPFSRRPKS